MQLQTVINCMTESKRRELVGWECMASHLGSVLVIIMAAVLIGLWDLSRKPTGQTVLRIIKYIAPSTVLTLQKQ